MAANGGVTSASSSYGASDSPNGTNNGDRKGQYWGSGGGWDDANAERYPDWLQVDFTVVKTIAEIHVFSIQDNYSARPSRLQDMEFTLYGLRDFEVQYWNGSAWQVV